MIRQTYCNCGVRVKQLHIIILIDNHDWMEISEQVWSMEYEARNIVILSKIITIHGDVLLHFKNLVGLRVSAEAV